MTLKNSSVSNSDLYIASSSIAFAYLKPLFHPHQEEIWILGLNREMSLLQSLCCFRGSVDSCMIHPREIFAPLIEMRASHFILAHNHPRGTPEPSTHDLQITKTIEKAGRLMMIPLIDHIILGDTTFVSLNERKLIKPKTTTLF
jgi:DNA repair protein RadC